MWYVYFVRCADDSLYCGITTDLQRRIQEHNGIRPGGSRYTRGRRPVELVYSETCENRSAASQREAELKKLPVGAKRHLLQGYESVRIE